MIEIAFRDLRKTDNSKQDIKKKATKLFIPPAASNVSLSNDVKLWHKMSQ